MERLLHDDDRRLGDALVVAVLARELDGALVGFQARVAEEHVVEAGDLGDAISRRLLVRDAPEVGGMDHAALDAPAQGLGQARVGIAERVHRDARQGIEVLLALLVPQPDAFAFDESDVLPGVRVHDMRHGGPLNAKRRPEPPLQKS